LIKLIVEVFQLTVVSVTLPGELLKKFDQFSKARGYYSRSEAFRDALRSLLAEAEVTKLEGGTVAATMMITCEYARRDVDLRMSEMRHEFDDIVVENFHRHIEQQYCLEVFIAEGNYQRVLELIGRIRGMRGIQEVKASFLPLKAQTQP
jgi:CopG family nickel-responsive transcriptional regulator